MGEKKQMTCGKPDIAIVKDKVTIAVFETKDIGKGDLDGKGKNQEQFDRYKQAINHIVFTDYVDFHGEFKDKESIVTLKKGESFSCDFAIEIKQ
jgi:hypothetical protein